MVEYNELTLDHLRTYGSNRNGDSEITAAKPKWLDVDKFRRGQLFFQSNAASLLLSMHASLLTGLSIRNLLDPLVFTNMSDTPTKALKRYVHTLYHILLWLTDPTIWDGPTSKAFRSISMVRRMHKSTADAMNGQKSGRTHTKFFSQYDMGLVQCGFMGAIIMYPTHFGVHCKEADLEDYVYTWRGLGYLLGVEDEFNICQGNLQQTLNIVKDIEQRVLLPALTNPPEHFDHMADAYIRGINLMSRGFRWTSRNAVLAAFFAVTKQPIPDLSFHDWLMLYLFKYKVFLISWVPGFRYFINGFVLRGMKALDGMAPFQF